MNVVDHSSVEAEVCRYTYSTVTLKSYYYRLNIQSSGFLCPHVVTCCILMLISPQTSGNLRLSSWSKMEFPDDFYEDSLFQNNFTDAYNETDTLLPTGVKITIVVVYMIVCVIGLVGNFLVMYVIIR